MKCLKAAVPALWIFLLAAPLSAGPQPVLTLCTWNIEHLAERDESGCRTRKSGDYRALRRYAAALDADIIALQEVENAAAVARVFDASEYRFDISGRPSVTLGTCRKDHHRRLMQRTGFAVRKDLEARCGIKVSRRPDVATLAVHPSERWGVHLVLTPADGDAKPLHLLCVHLKSGCAYHPPVYSRGDDSACSRLAVQVPRLEAWMDARAAAGEEFIVLGDMNRQLDLLGDAVWEALDDSESCRWRQTADGPWRCRKGTVHYNPIADLERARSGRAHPYPHNPKYPYAVDHIIMSAGADRMAIEKSGRFVRDRRGLSDHTPLVMDLRWPAP